jgi:peroxiredoxin Q/BCP
MRLPPVTRLLLGAALLAVVVPARAADAPAAAPRVGDVAPAFDLPYATRDTIGRSLTLASLVEKGKVVVAFYPADWSGGCTREVCTFRDNFAALGALGAQVVGISGDYVSSHHAWARHHELPFPLASDHSHDVAKAYASYDPSTGYNKRTVFVVDRNGRIAYVDMAYGTRDTVSFGKLRAALATIQ